MVEMLSVLLGIWGLTLILSVFLMVRPGERASSASLAEVSPEAERRAQQLVKETLSPSEYRQLSEYGFIDVPSPSVPQRFYRIPGDAGFVKIFENGKMVSSLCLHAYEPLPTGDIVLIHKFMIEANELDYLHKANHYLSHPLYLFSEVPPT